MGIHNPSAAYRELGWILREVRKSAGLTGAALAQRMGRPGIMISRMEWGKRDSTTVEVIQYVVTCGMTMPEARPILELTRIAERRQGHWLSDYRIGNTLQSLIFHESSAKRSIVYESLVIPGLLQTPAYARARISAGEPDLPKHRVASAVRTREERQQILHWEKPARFTFYVHEQALRLPVGGFEIMHEQLLHLVLTSAMDNVTVRIVPSAAGERSDFGGPFRVMEFDKHTPLVYLDHLHIGGLFLEDCDHVDSYYRLLPMLADVSQDEGQSREFVANLADEYDRGSQPDVAHHLAEEQLQRGGGDRLRGGGVAEPPTPIYE